VEKGGQAHRVFVLQSMPGIHRLEDLGLAFSLLGVEPERTVTIAVHREPAALAALAGALLLAAGVALSLRPRPAPVVGPDGAALPGAVLVALLLVAGRGAVLAWTFVVPGEAGPVPLPGVGVLFGVSLLAALAGALLLVAGRLSGDVAAVRSAGRGALWLAVTAAAVALVLAIVRVSGLPDPGAAALPLGGLALAVAWVVGALLAAKPGAAGLLARAAPLTLPLAVLAAVAVTIGAAVTGVLRDGTYATSSSSAYASAALLGLAALEPTRAPGLRRFAFVLFVLAPAVSWSLS
jgi:hypothetical protein